MCVRSRNSIRNSVNLTAPSVRLMARIYRLLFLSLVRRGFGQGRAISHRIYLPRLHSTDYSSYVLAGAEGSLHDSVLLRRALMKSFRLPKGRFSLADAGFGSRRGIISHIPGLGIIFKTGVKLSGGHRMPKRSLFAALAAANNHRAGTRPLQEEMEDRPP